MAIIPTSGEFTKVPEGGGALVCTLTGGMLDKTWSEISSAMANGNIVIVSEKHPDSGWSYSFVTNCSFGRDTYWVTATTSNYDRLGQAITSTAYVYTASSANGTLSIDKVGTVNYTM